MAYVYKMTIVLMLGLLCCVGCNKKPPMRQPRLQLWYFKNENCYIGSISNFPVDVNFIESSTFSIFWNINGKVNQIDIPNAPIFLTYSDTTKRILVVSMIDILEISPDTANVTKVKLSEKIAYYFGASSEQGDEILTAGRDKIGYFCTYYNCLTSDTKTAYTPSFVRGVSFHNLKEAFLNTEDDVFQFDIDSSTLVPIGKARKPSSRIKGSWNDTPVLYAQDDDEKSYLYWLDVTVDFESGLIYADCNGEVLWAIDGNKKVYKVQEDGTKEFIDSIGPGISGFGLLDNGLWIHLNNGKIVTYNSKGEKNSEISLMIRSNGRFTR